VKQNRLKLLTTRASDFYNIRLSGFKI